MASGKVEDVYRLSPIQQGILFHALRAPHSGTYFEQFSLRYGEDFEPAPFIAAWQTVVDRHPVLRSAFLWERLDQPVQGVHRRVEVPVDRQDWRDLDSAAQAQRLAAFVAADRQRGFRLTRPPLLRLTMLRLSDADYQVVWSYHHLVLDGWSAGLVMHEVQAAYEALRAGKPLAATAPRPYRDYVAWLRQQPLEQAEAFWRAALEGFAGPMPVGIERRAGEHRTSPRAGGSGDDWGLDLAKLSERQSAALKSFAQHHRLTLNSVVQGAWALLLARYSGRSDVVFGITVAGRPPALSQSERMVGCFINTLPLRLGVPGTAELVPWLETLQRQQIALRRFEHTPLGEILRWSGMGPRQELFSSILVFESFTLDASFEMTHSGVFQRTNYPLTVVVSPQRQMAIRLGYDRDRFAPADIARMQGHLRTLLAAMVATPAGRLSALPMLSADEREQITTRWNDTQATICDTPIVARIMERAAETPTSVALRDARGTLAYGTLCCRVAGLARTLQARGVGPEVRVALCLERSQTMVVALLAVLAAGGAYVPLDPEHPPRRLAYVLRDAGVALVLGEARTALRLETLCAELEPAPQILLLDTLAAAPESGPPAWPVERAQPESLAYLIYTSGSTGLPKGVGVPRRALANFLDAMRHRPGLGPQDVLLAVTTLSFDIAALELLLPLLVGAQVVIADRDQARDPSALLALLGASGASVMQATPATWRLLAAGTQDGDASGADKTLPRGLRVLAGGEPLPPALANALARQTREVWNLYGPTETTVWSSRARIGDAESITIGQPIENTVIHLIDADLQPVPVGVTGEIWIGGAGLARGYVGRAARTAARFVPDPVGREPGARLYRSGDLGRRRDDGAIECLGRIDHQLKVRGLRIEPGEIEHALIGDSVQEAVVMAIPAADGEPRLTAFAVPATGGALPPADILRARLATTLPGSMIPSSFIAVDALPVTPNGKLDRQALAARGAGGDHARPALAHPLVAPRNDLESTLAKLFEAVLERRPVGVDDSFFDLGGHSLLAVRLIGRMRQHLGRTVPLATLLANDTVAGLARAITARTPQVARDIVVELAPGAPGQRPFFVVHPIGGEVRCYRTLAARLPAEQPLFALQTPSAPACFADLPSMAARYVEAMRQVQQHGPFCLGGWSMGGVVAHEMACQLEDAGEVVAELWLLDARPPQRLGLDENLGQAERVALFARDLVGLSGSATETLVDAVRRHGDEDALEVALAHAKALDLVPAELALAEVRTRYDRYGANLTAFSTHAPRRYPGALTLVRARARLPTDPDGDRALGWGRWAGGGVTTLELGTDHFSLLRRPTVDRLAAALAPRLASHRAGHAVA